MLHRQSVRYVGKFFTRFFPILSIVIILNIASLTPVSSAEERMASGRRVVLNDLKTIQITISTKKGPLVMEAVCLDKIPGEVSQRRKGLIFTSFREKLARLSKRKKASKRSKLLLRQLIQAGQSLCNRQDDNPSEPGEEDPPVPAGLPLPPAPELAVAPLERYQGVFGPKQARILCNRVRFGCTAEEIDEFVRVGLEETVRRITTYVDEPAIAAVQEDLACDNYVVGEPLNKSAAECAPSPSASYNNNRSPFGIVKAYVHGALNSRSPYFYRLMFFLHNRFMATSFRAAQSNFDQHAYSKHLQMIKDAAISGDYREFMRRWPQDYLGHHLWLSGATNSGERPNEDFAREYWQLGTLGVFDLEGRLNYTDLDVAAAALAFSGWRTECESVSNDGDYGGYCSGVYNLETHARGPKRVFQGSKYETAVGNWEGVWHATFKNPRSTEYLAERLWKEYIGPDYSPVVIRQLAEVVRINEFNVNAVMRELMLSRYMFAPENNNEILKHPLDVLVGLHRTLDIGEIVASAVPPTYTHTFTTHSIVSEQLQVMGEVPFFPLSVFGFDEKKLASQQRLLDQRYALDRFTFAQMHVRLGWGALSNKEQAFYDRLVANLPAGQDPSRAVIDRAASWLNLELNASEKDVLYQFMSFRYSNCPNIGSLVLDGCVLLPDPFIVSNSSSYADYRWKSKLLGLLSLLSSLGGYRVT